MFTIPACGFLSAGLRLLFSAWILIPLAPLLLTVAVIYCVGAPDPLWASALWVVGLITVLNLGYLLGAAVRFVCIDQPESIELADVACRAGA